MASFLDNVVLEDFDFILEGEQAEAYKKRKADEREKEELAHEKRYGNKIQRTTLRGKDLVNDDWNTIKTGAVDHTNVKKAKMSTQDKINHAYKYENDYGKAHIAATREANKRSLDHKWGNTEKSDMTHDDNVAQAADAIARHNRRHPNAKIESTFFDDVELV